MDSLPPVATIAGLSLKWFTPLFDRLVTKQIIPHSTLVEFVGCVGEDTLLIYKRLNFMPGVTLSIDEIVPLAMGQIAYLMKNHVKVGYLIQIPTKNTKSGKGWFAASKPRFSPLDMDSELLSKEFNNDDLVIMSYEDLAILILSYDPNNNWHKTHMKA